jgi:hypothetical protein
MKNVGSVQKDLYENLIRNLKCRKSENALSLTLRAEFLIQMFYSNFKIKKIEIV